MIDKFKSGDPVRVWPSPGLLVQEHAGIAGRFLSKDGAELPWSDWLHDRVRDGSMLLSDPTPKAQPKQPEAAKGGK